MKQSAYLADGITSTGSPHEPLGLPMEVNWYEERDLTLDLRAKRSGSLSRIARELIVAPTHVSRGHIFRAMLAMTGFSQLSYATLELVDQRLFRVFCMKNYENSVQADLYFQERFFEIDIRAPLQRHRRPPIRWDFRSLSSIGKSARHHTARLNCFLNQLEGADIQSGMTFGILIPRTNLHAVVSLTSPNPSCTWIDDSTLGQGVALGMAVHELASRHVRFIAGQPLLTDSCDIQQRIVSCLTGGMSNLEIASHLGKSVAQVRDHLLLLQEKYGVAGRSQLAFVTGRLGLA